LPVDGSMRSTKARPGAKRRETPRGNSLEHARAERPTGETSKLAPRENTRAEGKEYIASGARKVRESAFRHRAEQVAAKPRLAAKRGRAAPGKDGFAVWSADGGYTPRPPGALESGEPRAGGKQPAGRGC